MTIAEQIAQGIAAATALRGQTLEWDGTDYPCSRRDTPTTSELQDVAGYVDDVSYWVVIAKSAFPDYDPTDPTTFPQIGDLVASSAHEVKALNGHKDPGAAQLILGIGSVDK